MKPFTGILTLLLASLAGCASFELPSINLQKYIPSLTGRMGQFRKPMRLVAFWTDTVRTAEGQAAMRGFGGRLMFYDHQHGKPVKVAGSLEIYAFDEAHSDPENPRPDRKFAFTADQFAKHYSKSELGHSYSVWIPWDRIGGESKEISLICRFTPVEGGAVVSEQVRQLLPGAKPTAAAAPAQAAAPVKLAHYQQSAELPAAPAAEPRMTTTTIELNGPPDRRLPTARMRPRPNLPAITAGMPASTSPMGAKDSAAPGSGPLAGQAPDRAAAQAASGSWLARFGRHQSRVPGEPIFPPDRERARWRPNPAAPPSGQSVAPTPTSTPALAPGGAATQP